ncbi:MAG: WD40 repeat domain-containing protein [Deltaproteobacteria bacterium]|nr:WD40 repeat domain-containing protein [Deltaproteobacteria bacterium]
MRGFARALAISAAVAALLALPMALRPLDAEPSLLGRPLSTVHLALASVSLLCLAIAWSLRARRWWLLALLPIAYAASAPIATLVARRGLASLVAADALTFARVDRLPYWARPAPLAWVLLLGIVVAALVERDPEQRVRRVLLRAGALLSIPPAVLGAVRVVRAIPPRPPITAPPPAGSVAPSTSAATVASAPIVAALPTRSDRYGDPLPAGALGRFGTLRFGLGARLQDHDGSGHLGFSPDGRALATLGRRGLHLWNVASRREEIELAGTTRRSFDAPCKTPPFIFSRDGKRLHVPFVGAWDTSTGAALPDVQAKNVSIKTLAVSADRSVFAWTSGSGVQVVRVDDGKVVAGLAASDVRALDLSADGKRLALAFSRRVRVVDTASGDTLLTRDLGSGFAPTATTVAIRPDGATVAALSRDFIPALHGSGGYSAATMTVLDVASGVVVKTIDGLEASALAYSPDGKALVASGIEHVLWDSSTFAERARAPFGGDCRSHAFSADSRLVALATERDVHGSHSGASVIDVATGALRFKVTGARYQLHSLSFSPDGKVLATSAGNGIHLYDVDTGSEIDRDERAGHWSRVQFVAVSPSGDRLVTTSTDVYGDHSMRFWALPSTDPLRAVENGGNRIAWAPGGARAALTRSSAIEIFDPETGVVEKTLRRVPYGPFDEVRAR